MTERLSSAPARPAVPGWARLLLLVLFCAGALPAFSQHDPIEGNWLSESGNAKMQVYRTPDGTFSGKIVWLKEPMRDGHTKVDARNPDEHLRSRPIVGLQILRHLRPVGSNEYEDGSVYDPKAGKTYECKATLRTNDALDLRGFLGVSLLGKTMHWTRTN